jgi:hypothetical protein
MTYAPFPVCQAPGNVAQTWHTPSAENRGPGYASFQSTGLTLFGAWGSRPG